MRQKWASWSQDLISHLVMAALNPVTLIHRHYLNSLVYSMNLIMLFNECFHCFTNSPHEAVTSCLSGCCFLVLLCSSYILHIFQKFHIKAHFFNDDFSFPNSTGIFFPDLFIFITLF